MSPEVYSVAFKISYLLFLIPTLLVVVSASLSVQHMGGSLGKGLKKIAAGSIIHTMIITSYLLLEHYGKDVVNDRFIWLSFVINGICGSSFLILGYLQVYKIAKQLKLFTP